jgi:hypothetical protein
VTLAEVLRDVLARIVWLREALETGEVAIAFSLLLDLEHDIAAALAQKAIGSGATDSTEEIATGATDVEAEAS